MKVGVLVAEIAEREPGHLELDVRNAALLRCGNHLENKVEKQFEEKNTLLNNDNSVQPSIIPEDRIKLNIDEDKIQQPEEDRKKDILDTEHDLIV